MGDDWVVIPLYFKERGTEGVSYAFRYLDNSVEVVHFQYEIQCCIILPPGMDNGSQSEG